MLNAILCALRGGISSTPVGRCAIFRLNQPQPTPLKGSGSAPRLRKSLPLRRSRHDPRSTHRPINLASRSGSWRRATSWRRTLFQSLVTVGDPRGARGVAQTFDPQVLDRYPASGVVPDQAEAARWRAIAARLETRQRRNQGEPSP